MIARPTGSEPVNAIACTRGSRTSAAPTWPSPGSNDNTERGTPPARSACSSRCAKPGDCSAGLSTTALPTASAAAVIPQAIASGKFHGEITATTPRGAYASSLRSPGTCNSSRPCPSAIAPRA